MTSIYGSDPVYYLNGPCAPVPYSYRCGSVMDYIYRHCPVFAVCAQKSTHDTWLDDEDFGATCFMPSSIYSARNLTHFRDVDVATARDLVLSSIIRGVVDVAHLSSQEFLPTYKQSYLKVTVEPSLSNASLRSTIYVNGLPIRESIQCDNGIIHVLDGFVY